MAGHAQPRAQVTCAQRFGLAHQRVQRPQLAPQQPQGSRHRQDHGQQAADGQAQAYTPGHLTDFRHRHARHHRPRAFDKCGRCAVQRLLGIGWWHQPLTVLVLQGQRTGLANAETLEVGKLGVLRIGVVEANEQYGDYPAVAVTHRHIAGHVVALEQHGAANVHLPGQQLAVGRVLTVELSADGAAAVLLLQVGADAHEVFATAHEQRGDASGHLLEFVNLLKIVVQQMITQVQRRCCLPGDLHRFTGMQRQARGEAALEQPAEALGIVLERTVEGFELVGQQARFTAQVRLACGEVGIVQRTQGKQGTAGNHQRQHDGEGDTELRGYAGTGLRHVKLLARGRDRPDHTDRPLSIDGKCALFRDAGASESASRANT